MLYKFISNILITLVLIFSLSSKDAFSGPPPQNQFFSETASALLLSYFDLRQRSTQVQVTNIDSVESVTIHVQIFADAFECEDRDFTDTLTPNETHVYDIANLVSANGNPINFAIPDGSHGFVVITAGDGIGASVEQIIGNFRIIDSVGYEYRVNSAAELDPTVLSEGDRVGRFTNNWGATHADIVGVDVDDSNNFLPDGTRDVSVDIADAFELFIFDDEETGTSCGQVFMGCDEEPGSSDNEPQVFTAEFINQGINDSFPNSRDGGVLCEGDFNTDGYVNLRDIEVNLRLVAFSGLNDGAGRGSMDRFKSLNLVMAPPPG